MNNIRLINYKGKYFDFQVYAAIVKKVRQFVLDFF